MGEKMKIFTQESAGKKTIITDSNVLHKGIEFNVCFSITCFFILIF